LFLLRYILSRSIINEELADKHDWFWPNQFENEANAWIHRETTGPEIFNAFHDAGKTLDHFGK
jgi:cysteine synthase A